MLIDSFTEYGLYIKPITGIQRRFLNDNEHRFFIIPSGRRSRKSLISSLKVLNWAMLNEGRYFLGAPTRDQSKKIFWDKLKKRVQLLDVYIHANETELSVKLRSGDGSKVSEIVVVGLDKPERIEGQPWHGCHITEFPNLKPKAWQENIRPVLSDTNGFAILDGVPDFREPNFDQYHKLAQRACGGRIPETIPGLGAYGENGEWVYYAWLSEDVLSESEIISAKEELDEKIYLQEYCGQFISMGGQVYYCFNETNIIDYEFKPNLDTWISYDFGVGQGYMSVGIFQIQPDGKIVMDKEFFIQNSNTSEVTDMAVDYLKANSFSGRLGVTGDYSGNTKQSTSATTDYMIIDQIIKRTYYRNYNKNAGGLGNKVRSTPSVKDRVNLTNAAFRNANKDQNLFINSNNVFTIDDLRKTVWDEDTNRRSNGETLRLSKADPKRTHLSDMVSYICLNLLYKETMNRN